jgi:drug/metabolite transporter (DMT)-like permease
VLRRTATIVVLVSAVCFGTLAVLAVLAYEHGARPLPLLAWRFAIASVVLSAYLAVRRPRDLAAGIVDLPKYALLSITGYGAASVCFFFALQHASASVVTVLLYTYPALVASASTLLFGERLGSARIAALLLTFAGCALAVGLFGQSQQVSPLGVVLGLGAAAGYGAFSLISSRMLAGRSRLVVMAYTFGLSAVGISIVALVAGESLSPSGWSPTLWALLAAIVALPTFAAVVLYLEGIRVLGAPRAAIVSTAEPVFTIALAALLLGDRLTLLQMLGAGLVLAGIVIAEWPRGAADEIAIV